MRFVEGEGLRLAVFEAGLRSNPTVVLVHGFPDDHRVWSGVIDALSARFHVVAYDVRGAGESDAPPDTAGYAIARLYGDLRAVLKATAPGKRVHLVGHDWGSIQLWGVVTDPAIAGLARSFTTLSGPGLDQASRWMRRALTSGGARDVLRQLGRSWYIAAFQLPRVPEWVVEHRIAPGWVTQMRETEGLDEPEPLVLRNALNAIGLYRANVGRPVSPRGQRDPVVPTQFLVAEDDLYVTSALVRGVAAATPGAELHSLDGGHWVLRRDPALVAEKIADFVARHEG